MIVEMLPGFLFLLSLAGILSAIPIVIGFLKRTHERRSIEKYDLLFTIFLLVLVGLIAGFPVGLLAVQVEEITDLLQVIKTVVSCMVGTSIFFVAVLGYSLLKREMQDHDKSSE